MIKIEKKIIFEDIVNNNDQYLMTVSVKDGDFYTQVGHIIDKALVSDSVVYDLQIQCFRICEQSITSRKNKLAEVQLNMGL